MFSNHPKMAKKWAAHTPENANLPEHVKTASVIRNWGFEKKAQTIVPFNKASIDSAYASGQGLIKQLSSKPAGEAFGDLTKIVGQPIHHAIPRAAVTRNWLTRFTQSPQYVEIGRANPRDTTIINKGLRTLSEGENVLRTEAPNWNYGKSAWEGGWMWLGNRHVNKALSVTQKYDPKSYQQFSSYVGNRGGKGFVGDTTRYKNPDSTFTPMKPDSAVATPFKPDSSAKKSAPVLPAAPKPQPNIIAQAKPVQNKISK